jgi:hypothetical protein
MLHTSHVTRHTSHVTRHTSHVTRHTSHVTRNLRSRAFDRQSASSTLSLQPPADHAADAGHGGKRLRARRKAAAARGAGGGSVAGVVGEGEGGDTTPNSTGKAGGLGSGSKVDALMEQSIDLQVGERLPRWFHAKLCDCLFDTLNICNIRILSSFAPLSSTTLALHHHSLMISPRSRSLRL